jgi:Na+-driven multidrug efflux pump
MTRAGRIRQWSVLLFLLAVLLFTPPFLHIYNKPDIVFGMPLAYLGIFTGWALVVLLTALLGRRHLAAVAAGRTSRTPAATAEEGGES